MNNSRGKVFRNKIKINRDRGVNKAEQAEFSKKCIAYGLSPDFYEEGCLSPTGEFFVLVGFDGDNCILRSENGEMAKASFKRTIHMIQENILNDMVEVSEKAFLLYEDVRCQNAIAVKRELKADLRAKSECADKALDIFNGHMDEVLVKMNMPADALGIGFQYNNRFLEFVSYRKDNVSPYILEDINMPHMNSHRFKAMSFDEFQTCLTKYAKKEKNSYLMDIALNMKPVKEDSEDTNLEADFEGQLRLFAC